MSDPPFAMVKNIIQILRALHNAQLNTGKYQEHNIREDIT